MWCGGHFLIRLGASYGDCDDSDDNDGDEDEADANVGEQLVVVGAKAGEERVVGRGLLGAVVGGVAGRLISVVQQALIARRHGDERDVGKLGLLQSVSKGVVVCRSCRGDVMGAGEWGGSR